VRWESSAKYSAIINHELRDRLGASHSTNVLTHSLDFALA
jgi:aspartate/glutamate racemase